MPHTPEQKARWGKAYRQRPEVKEKRRGRRRGEHLTARYGLSFTDIERLFVSQGGVCAACFDEISLIEGSSNYRSVDHNHSKVKGDPGFIRGLLCNHCNVAAGNLKDCPNRCLLLAAYLKGG